MMITSKKLAITVLVNRRVDNREIAEDVNIAYGTTQQILVHVLGMKRTNARLVPKYVNLLLPANDIV